jgi:hypothetical protein
VCASWVGLVGRLERAAYSATSLIRTFHIQLKEDIQHAWDVNIYTQLWSENVKGGNHFAGVGVQRRVMLTLVEEMWLESGLDGGLVGSCCRQGN